MKVSESAIAEIKEMGFVVVSVSEFEFKGAMRKAIKVRKPRGRKLFEIVEYDNGLLSQAA